MPQKKCDLCEREFGSYQGLIQHYAVKHPDATPPKDVVKREELRKKRNSSHTAKGRQNKLLIISAIVIVIIVIASVGVYYSTSADKLSAHNTTSGIIYGINAGNYAKDIPITLTNGTTTSLSKFSGGPVLLWFVATWCSSCTQGAQMLNQQYYSELHAKGVTIIVVELYNDLNEQGPSISQFANQYGGGVGKPGWLYGTSTQSASYTYDPQSDLDIYYLINPTGVILTSGVGLPNDLQSVVTAA